MKPLPTPIARKSEFRHKSGWRLELDRDQIIPDNPGEGTPAMVYSPNDKGAGTYWCAIDNGEVGTNDDNGNMPVPGDVLAWLLTMGYYVEQYMEAGPMEDSNASATAAG